MKRSLLSFVFLLLILNLNSQVKPVAYKSILDSVVLKEVIVTGALPVTNNSILNFFRSRDFTSIEEIESRIGGISLMKRGAYAMEPVVDGFSGGQLNITIDGMKIFGACTDRMDPVTSYIEPANLRKLTINKGTHSCGSGSNVGGSVELSLNDPSEFNEDTPLLTAGLGYETAARAENLQLAMNRKAGKWAYLFNGTYRKASDYIDGNGTTVPFSHYRKANLTGSLSYSPDSSTIIKTDLLYDIAGSVGYPALPMDVSRAEALIWDVEYRKTGKSDFRAKAYINTITHIMDDSQRDSVYFLRDNSGTISDTVLMRMDMPGYSTTAGAFAQYDFKTGKKSNLQVKLDHYTNFSLAEMTMFMHYLGGKPEKPMYMQTWPSMMRSVTGLYLQNKYRISSELSVTFDGRIDFALDHQRNELAKEQFSVLGYNLSRNISGLAAGINGSLKYSPSDRFIMNMTVGYSGRLPTITERYGYYLYNAYDGYDYIGNPGLKNEKSLFTELKLSYISAPFRITVSQNLSRLSDYIAGKTDTSLRQLNFYASGLRIYQNYEGAVMASTGIQFFLFPVNNISLYSSLNYTQGRFLNGEALPLIAPMTNTLALLYEKNRFMVRAENVSALTQNRINSEYGEKVTPGFSVYNLKTSYRMPVDRSSVELSAGVTNLFNKSYFEHLDWGRILRPGRSFEISVRYIL